MKDTGYMLKFSPADLLKGDTDLQGMFNILLQEYAKEIDLQSNLLSFYSLRSNRPLLKTNKLPSSFFGRMRQLQEMISSSHSTSKTIKRFVTLWKELRKDITNSIPTEIIELLKNLPGIPIQLFSDLPLEWIEINGTPLMFHRRLSRLPLMSANGLCAHYQITEEPLRLSFDLEKPKVLFIDAILDEDPVKPFTKATYSVLVEGEISSGFDLAIHEVRHTDEFFEILKREKPTICVIDAHAKYDTTEDQGYFKIGEDEWNPWVRTLPFAPPIMILNSCQTSVVDGTFNTAANGLLAAGVRSVIGTLFPISAEVGTHMCVRLFANLLAAMLGDQKLRTWRDVVSKTIMLNHYLDYKNPFRHYLARKDPSLLACMSKFPIDYAEKWSTIIRKEDKIFEDLVLQTVEAVLDDYGLSKHFEDFMKKQAILPETAFYVSLGTPESIIIHEPGEFDDIDL